jgi:hypothetical protein
MYYYCYYYLISQVYFPLVLLLLNQWCTPPLRLQVSLLCAKSLVQLFFLYRIYWILSWYCFQIFFSPLVTVPVAAVITSMLEHFIFHIHWISILRFLYFNSFQSRFVLRSYLMVLIRLSICKFCLLCNYCVWHIGQNFCMCSYSLIP